MELYYQKTPLFLLGLYCFLVSNGAYTQTATIREEIKTIKTYTFGDANPVPILKENPKIYPYYKFEAYQHRAKNKNWKVITLENKYIQLSVLPEVGGKIWGAIEKQSGKEFIYKNKVLKFRNIALRGPWTSGGIEFNFGIIGHSPATATPVDYKTRENADGSVSCIVGAMDLPSRTRWWVEIKLEADKAYFETKASWYNPTALNQSYYNWMTAAAEAKEDLEFFIPGNKYLKHDGNAIHWPFDKQERNLAYYKNNNFGSHKSYHIVGHYKDFFGGYYHKSNFGFGHWSRYEEMPGQKLWLWALSRSGGIWEDLLTDTDGQYIEFQSGRLFNQYQPDLTLNPITQANFEPYMMDRWREIWFPFKEIGGMVDASEYGILNVEYQNDEVYVGLNSLQELNENLKVFINGALVLNEPLKLKPWEVFSNTIQAKPTDRIEVILGENKLYYISNIEASLLKRPFYADENLKISIPQKLYTEAWEFMKYREFDKAFDKLSKLIEIDASHKNGLLKLSELEYRRTNYDRSLEYANSVLMMDTYDPEANYRAALVYNLKRDYTNALECFGWAARAIEYKSVALAQMAEVYLDMSELGKAKEYALKALDFNTFNLNARKIILVIARKKEQLESFKMELNKILEIDPLNHFAAFEASLLDAAGLGTMQHIQNEFVEESILELALEYINIGLYKESMQVLLKAANTVKVKLWISYLLRDSNVTQSQRILKESLLMPAEFVSPYRRETIAVLEWATKENINWKLSYYLAQNYLAVGLKEKAFLLLKACKNKPNIESFYRFRAVVIENASYAERLSDYQKALTLNDKDWKIWDEVIRFFIVNKKYKKAYSLGMLAVKKFPENYNIKLLYAKTLFYSKHYMESIDVLKDLKLLPSELGDESREVYYNSHLYLATEYIKKEQYKKAVTVLKNSKVWPENLGLGKPYDVDTRLEDFLIAIYDKKLTTEQKKALLYSIIDFTKAHLNTQNINHLFGLLSLEMLGVDSKNLLLELKNVNTDNSDLIKLVIAFFENDEPELILLKNKAVLSDELWELMHVARSFK